MDFDKHWETVKMQLDVIRKAPVPFGSAIVLSIIALYFLFQWYFGKQIADLKTIVELKNERIASFTAEAKRPKESPKPTIESKIYLAERNSSEWRSHRHLGRISIRLDSETILVDQFSPGKKYRLTPLVKCDAEKEALLDLTVFISIPESIDVVFIHTDEKDQKDYEFAFPRHWRLNDITSVHKIYDGSIGQVVCGSGGDGVNESFFLKPRRTGRYEVPYRIQGRTATSGVRPIDGKFNIQFVDY